MAKITLSEIKHMVSKNKEKGGTAPLLQPDPAPLDGTFLPQVSESSLAEGSLNSLQSPTGPPSTVANAHNICRTLHGSYFKPHDPCSTLHAPGAILHPPDSGPHKPGSIPPESGYNSHEPGSNSHEPGFNSHESGPIPHEPDSNSHEPNSNPHKPDSHLHEPDSHLHKPGNTITSPNCFQSGRIPAVPPHKVYITPEIEEKMKNVEGAFTIRELSEKFHIPAPALYRWARINRYKAKNGNRSSPIPVSTRQQIISSLDSMTTCDLAREYDIPYHILYHWMKKEGLSARNVSGFSPDIQKEIREKCRTFSLKTLALEYGLSQQAMRSRLRRIGCFSDGKNGFLVVDGQIGAEIEAFYKENGLEKTASAFHTTRTAIKSFLKYLENSKGSNTL